MTSRTNPLLIVEILSGSSKRIDLKKTFDSHTQIPPLLESVGLEMPVQQICRQVRREVGLDVSFL